jgi:glycosyltransferase involved in cell wall biosynthesis
MRILQLLPARPSEYEKKSQRIDFELLRGDHEVFVGERVSADLTLTYGRPPVSELPEAVEEAFFELRSAGSPAGADRLRAGPTFTIVSFRRRAIIPIVEQSMIRLHRTRDDIDWLLLDDPPTDFQQFDVWVDPAVDEDDLDGFVAEAQVCGKIVAASRTPINIKRLEKGRTGLLVPPRDSNELTHAILTALFKPEVAQQKIEAAGQTISKYRPRNRLRALRQLLTTK